MTLGVTLWFLICIWTYVWIYNTHTQLTHKYTYTRSMHTITRMKPRFLFLIIFRLISYVNFIQRMFQIVNNWTFYLNLKKWNKNHSAIISCCITPIRNAPFLVCILGLASYHCGLVFSLGSIRKAYLLSGSKHKTWSKEVLLVDAGCMVCHVLVLMFSRSQTGVF